MIKESDKELVRKNAITKERLGKNPFLRKLEIKVNTVPKYGQYEKDKDGEYYTVQLELESDSYCRVYTDSERRLEMSVLSARAKDLLLWMIYETEAGCEWIWVNNKRYMRESSVKAYNTYKNALRELLMADFIQATVIQNAYWINPHYFFNGSRANAFPDKIVRK